MYDRPPTDMMDIRMWMAMAPPFVEMSVTFLGGMGDDVLIAYHQRQPIQAGGNRFYITSWGRQPTKMTSTMTLVSPDGRELVKEPVDIVV